ncbi:hypothetical protein BH11PAT1_BH11PAT1_5110 [soil metagenome]
MKKEIIDSPDHTHPEKKYMTIRIPSKVSPTQIMIGGLIISSFFLGMLWQKVQYLETNGGSGIKVAALQMAPQAAPQGNQAAAKSPAGKVKDVSDDERIRGNKNAKVTLVEYSDYECPFCKRFHPTTQELMKTYGDKIRLVFRDYPLSFHQNAQKEAEAGRCIAELGGNNAFWSYTDKIFERTTANGTGFALTDLGPLAAEVGVNQQSFQQCLDSSKYTQVVKDQIVEGSTAGVSGTPATFIIDSKGKTQMLVGAQPVEAFKTVIDQALK